MTFPPQTSEMATREEQDMQVDSEGDQNSVDSFEKQLRQQELELKQEKESQQKASENTSWMVRSLHCY